MKNAKSQEDLLLAFNKQLNFLLKFCYEYDMGNEDISIMIAGVLRTLLDNTGTKKDFDSSLTKQAEELKSICEIRENFMESDIFKKGQTLARSILGQIKNEQRKQVQSNSLLGLLNALEVKFADTLIEKDRFSGYHINIASSEKNIIGEMWVKVQEMAYRDHHPYSGLCYKHIIIDAKKVIKQPRFYPLFMRRENEEIFLPEKEVSFNQWWNGIVFDDFSGNQLTRREIIKVVADKEGYAHVDKEFFPQLEYYKKPLPIELGYSTDRISGVYENTPVGATIRQIAYELIFTINKHLSHLIDYTRPNFDLTPVGFKLSFIVTVDSEKTEKMIISTILSKRPFIQRLLISSHFKDDPGPDKRFIINSIMPLELQKILDALKEKNFEIRNIQKENL